MTTMSFGEKTSTHLSDSSGKSTLKFEALETGKIFDDAKAVSNNDTISNSERINFRTNFWLNPNYFGERSSIDSKSSSISSTKELGNDFSKLDYKGAKADTKKKNTSSEFSFGIKTTLLEVKPTSAFENSAASNNIEPKNSTLVSNENNSSTSSSKEDGNIFSRLASDSAKPDATPNTNNFESSFSKLASDDIKTGLNKNTTHNSQFSFGVLPSNSKYGPRRYRTAVHKISKEKAVISTSNGFIFGSTYASEKSEEKASESTSTGFTFKSIDPKYQEKTPESTSTGFTFKSINPKYQGPGTPVKFSPFIGTDMKMSFGVHTTISTRHQSITLMKEYSTKSFEELRLEDYKWSQGVWNSKNSSLQKGRLSFSWNFLFGNTNTNTSNFSNFTFGATEAAGAGELLKGLEELLLSGKHSDVTLTVQGKEFTAHRAILGIRSPVFAAMMKHDTKEKATGVVNIPDCDPDPFSDFLHFLYTGSTKKLNSSNVLDLYTLADKYQVSELCKICVNYMKNNITLQNFCDILTLSLRHYERELIDVASQFFLKNSTDIAETVNWSLFLKENPVAANELFLKALNLYKK